MTAAEFEHVQSRVRRNLYPLQTEAIAQLSKGLADITEGMAATKRLVCERAAVRIDADGEVRGQHESEPAPRLSAVKM